MKELKWILIWILAFTCGYCSAQSDTTEWAEPQTITIDSGWHVSGGSYFGSFNLQLAYPDKEVIYDSVSILITVQYDSLSYSVPIRPLKDGNDHNMEYWMYFVLDLDRRLKVIEQRLGILK